MKFITPLLVLIALTFAHTTSALRFCNFGASCSDHARCDPIFCGCDNEVIFPHIFLFIRISLSQPCFSTGSSAMGSNYV